MNIQRTALFGFYYDIDWVHLYFSSIICYQPNKYFFFPFIFADLIPRVVFNK